MVTPITPQTPKLELKPKPPKTAKIQMPKHVPQKATAGAPLTVDKKIKKLRALAEAIGPSELTIILEEVIECLPLIEQIKKLR